MRISPPKTDTRLGALLLLNGVAVWFIAILYAAYGSAVVDQTGQGVTSLTSEITVAWIESAQVGILEAVGYGGLAVAVLGPTWYWVVKPVRERLHVIENRGSTSRSFRGDFVKPNELSDGRDGKQSTPATNRNFREGESSASADWISNVFESEPRSGSGSPSSAGIQNTNDARFTDGGNPAPIDQPAAQDRSQEALVKAQYGESGWEAGNESVASLPQEMDADTAINGTVITDNSNHDSCSIALESEAAGKANYISKYLHNKSTSKAAPVNLSEPDERRTPVKSLETAISESRAKIEAVSEKLDHCMNETKIEAARDALAPIQNQTESSIGPS